MKRLIGISIVLITSLYIECIGSASDRRSKMYDLEPLVLNLVNTPEEAAKIYMQFVQDPENRFYIDRQYELLRMRGELILLAAAFGHAEVVKTLLQGGTPVDTATYFGKTALFYAVENNNIEVAQILLAYGANMHARSRYNETPFELAARFPELAYLFQLYN